MSVLEGGMTSNLEGMDSVSEVLPLTLLQHFVLPGHSWSWSELLCLPPLWVKVGCVEWDGPDL